ncbi:MAG TPA: SIMPL domain-containing protein [Terriglobia bacterium]|nr:SIMPL domain-containing protein [Terriglobia bacterium]
MKHYFALGVAAFVLCATLSAPAKARKSAPASTEDQMITVTRGGTAYAKPDVGILIMTIQAYAPVAGQAVAANEQKAAAVKSALEALGYSADRYKLSSVVLSAPVPPYNPYPPSTQEVEAERYVYVFFDGPQLSDLEQMTGSAASAIEALQKAGAVPDHMPTTFRSPGPMQTATIIYTIKNPEEWESQALQQAVKRTRAAAEAIAAQMQVQITGVRSVRAGAQSGQYIPTSNLTELKGLPYSFFSTRSDEVEISAGATVNYAFK